MAKTEQPDTDSEILQLRQDFEAWRQGRLRREPIPEPLWARAVQLARRHGVTRTSRALQLGYQPLKARLEASRQAVSATTTVGRPAVKSAGFVELPPLSVLAEGHQGISIEGRRPDGASIHIRVPKGESVDLVGTLTAFWTHPCCR